MGRLSILDIDFSTNCCELEQFLWDFFKLSSFRNLFKLKFACFLQEVYQVLRGSQYLRFKQHMEESLIVIVTLDYLSWRKPLLMVVFREWRHKGLRIFFQKVFSQIEKIMVVSLDLPFEWVCHNLNLECRLCYLVHQFVLNDLSSTKIYNYFSYYEVIILTLRQCTLHNFC